MNTAEMRPAGLWSVEEIEAGVESMLFRQLLRERMRQTPNEVDRELQELALDAFEEWADGYGLPTTPHVLAAYLVELHSEGEQADILEFVAAAYLNQNKRDVHVPILAALQYCSNSCGHTPDQRNCFKNGGFQVGSRIANGLGIMRQCLETRTLDQLGERLEQLESTGGTSYGTTKYDQSTHPAPEAEACHSVVVSPVNASVLSFPHPCSVAR